MIYADHAATTRLDAEAFEAMKPYLLSEFGNASQPYSFARTPKKALKAARETIAACMDADPGEIYFTSGGTESDNWAIKGASLFHKDGAVITSSIEHHAVLHSCRTLERLGHPVAFLPVNKEGIVQADDLREVITESTRLVSIMFANNEIGTIQPMRELAEITHANGVIFHTDAVQAVGHVPISVRRLGIDLLSASAHKFHGPKGAGFLFIRKGVELVSHMDGGAQESARRAGTENVAAIVGMAAALRRSCDEMRNRAQRLYELEQILMDRLRAFRLDFIRNGGAKHIPGNISLSFKGADGEALLHRLDLMGICVSTGSACNSASTELSHVIRAIRVPEEYAYGTIRISLGYENTESDVEAIAAALKKILGASVMK